MNINFKRMIVLKINSSAARETSQSRKQVDNITSRLLNKYQNAKVIDRDVAYSSLPFLDYKFLDVLFYSGKLTKEQKKITAVSDMLVEELLASDILVIGAPMYNFGIPASLKAYFDLIARAGKTFQYNEQGYPVGLLKNKKAIVVITTGGVTLGSPMDFSKNYISTFLAFLGIKDIDYIELDENKFKLEEKKVKAEQKLDTLLN